MSRRPAALAAVLLLAGCWKIQPPPLDTVSTFAVDVKGVFQVVNGARGPLDVVTSCATRYGGQSKVPAAERGTPGCHYVIPRGEVEIDFEAKALDGTGAELNDFTQPLSYRVDPGDLSGDYTARWGQMTNGVLTGTVKTIHVFGEVRVWVLDAAPEPIYAGGALGGNVSALPVEPGPGTDGGHRTQVAGASPTVFFDDPTLQALQVPDGFDNRSSPLVGAFVTVGRNPESGGALLQSCPDDPRRDGKPSAMVVTGIDPSGFFVSDVTACRLQEWTKDSTGAVQVRTPELPEKCLAALADGGTRPVEDAGVVGSCAVSEKTCRSSNDCPRYLPGTFGHMFIYNYSYPDGLSVGDLLFTVSGSVQEFTSTTQMTFPGWTIAESVRTLPPDQWNKWLQYTPPKEITQRTCGMDDSSPPFLTDALCGHNKRNLKMESLEAGLVLLRGVRFPTVFENCDFNADGTVDFFCEQKDPGGSWFWGSCNFTGVDPPNSTAERTCNQECVIGYGKHAGDLCAEASTFQGYGQFPVEMNLPGPSKYGLDDSLPSRITTVPLTANTVAHAGGYGAGVYVSLVCDTPVHWKAGDGTETPAATDASLGAGEVLRYELGQSETSMGVVGAAAGTCWVGYSAKSRINLTTKDAIPELQVNCDPNDADAQKAQQCKNLHGATFDVIGHLMQVQPARPRWNVIPRDVDDVCCHPGPGLDCPKPIKPCP